MLQHTDYRCFVLSRNHPRPQPYNVEVNTYIVRAIRTSRQNIFAVLTIVVHRRKTYTQGVQPQQY